MTRSISILTLLIVAIMAAGCAGDSTPAAPAIAFKLYTSRPVIQTRANTKKPEKFLVDVFYNSSTEPDFMHDQLVSQSGNGYSYSPIKYWPAERGKLKFFAYWLGENTKFTVTNGGYEAEIEADGKTDMLYSHEQTPQNFDPVKFNMHHLLSQIKIVLTPKPGLEMKINKIQLAGVKNKAQITIRNNPPQYSSMSTSSLITLDNNDNVIVVPQEIDVRSKFYVSYNMVQTNSKGESVVYNDQHITAVIPRDKIKKWEAGKTYTYKWQIEPHKIEFNDVSVEEWSVVQVIDKNE